MDLHYCAILSSEATFNENTPADKLLEARNIRDWIAREKAVEKITHNY